MFRVSVSDTWSGVSSVFIRVEGGGWVEMSVTPEGDYAYAWKETAYEDNGYHAYEVRVADGMGNEATYADEVKVDNPKDMTIYYVTAAVIAIIVLVVLALYMRRRKKLKEEAWEEGDDMPPAKVKTAVVPSAREVNSPGVPQAVALPPHASGVGARPPRPGVAVKSGN
jgi:hypothetical protein